MGTSQTSKLLTYLLSERERWVSASLLSERLSVSTRQIRKYITKLNEDAAGMLIISSSMGYRLDLKRYQEYIKNKIDFEETPATRQNYILQKLICEKGGYDIFDLADELYVSNATIENDLKIVRKIIRDYHLVIKRDKDAIRIIGTEIEKRKLMSLLISSDSYDNFILKDEIPMLTFHYNYKEIYNEIKKIFNDADIFANDYTLNNTVLHLVITIDRVRNHHQLEDSVDMDKIIESNHFNVAKQINEYIENTFDIYLNNAELYNLALVIINNTTMLDYSSISPANISNYIEKKYIDIAHKIIRDVEVCYYLDPFDEDFITKLYEIIYVFLTIFLYLLKCPQSLILSALRAFCFCGKPHISRSIFLYFRYQTWLKSW